MIFRTSGVVVIVILLCLSPPKPCKSNETLTAQRNRTSVVNSTDSTSDGARAEKREAAPTTKMVTDTNGDGPVIKAAISSSRLEVAGNAAYGVFADLENVTSVPVTLYPVDTQLVIQPEVAGDQDCLFTTDGFYPTEPGKSEQLQKGGPIVIQPKEHYAVFWDVSKSNTGECLTGTEQPQSKAQKNPRSGWEGLRRQIGEQLSFVPGDYTFVLVGKAHRTPDGKEEDTYHTYTDKVKIHVGLSQIDTMIAAMFGGVIGYLVMALRDTGDLGKLRTQTLGTWTARIVRGLVIVKNLLSAALVSAVVTVILSRISDTQFPIKVSVNDFWGALTIGFVAYFVGNKVIDRIVGLASP
jgi:hypothetical protein